MLTIFNKFKSRTTQDLSKADALQGTATLGHDPVEFLNGFLQKLTTIEQQIKSSSKSFEPADVKVEKALERERGAVVSHALKLDDKALRRLPGELDSLGAVINSLKPLPESPAPPISPEQRLQGLEPKLTALQSLLEEVKGHAMLETSLMAVVRAACETHLLSIGAQTTE